MIGIWAPKSYNWVCWAKIIMMMYCHGNVMEQVLVSLRYLLVQVVLELGESRCSNDFLVNYEKSPVSEVKQKYAEMILFL